jgi:hypothetical protein
MTHRLLNLLSLLSLLLCVGATAAAVVGRRHGSCVGWERRVNRLEMGGEGGECQGFSAEWLADRFMLVRSVETAFYPNDRDDPAVYITRQSKLFCSRTMWRRGS